MIFPTPPACGTKDFRQAAASSERSHSADNGGQAMLAIGRESKCRTNIRNGKFRVIRNDVVFAHPLSQPVQHVVDRNPKIANARLAATLAGINRNSLRAFVAHTELQTPNVHPSTWFILPKKGQGVCETGRGGN